MSQSAPAPDMSSIISTLLSSPDFAKLMAGVMQEAVKPTVSRAGLDTSGSQPHNGVTLPGRVAEVEEKELEEERTGGSVSSGSWADECNSAASEDSLVLAVKAVKISDTVRASVKFGGLADNYDAREGAVTASMGDGSGNFMRTCVKTPAVKGLKKFVEERAGVKIPKSVMAQFALCSYSAATVPGGFVNGKTKMKQLESIGDAALTMHAVMLEVSKGVNVEGVQAVRSRMTSNNYLSRVANASGLMKFVSCASGIDLNTAKTSADALEAVVGFLALYHGNQAVYTFLQNMQLV